MNEDKILAWVYLQFRNFIMGMPSSVGDLIDAPRWFEKDIDLEESSIYQMIEIADKKAKEIVNDDMA